jgi:hypothetical protein
MNINIKILMKVWKYIFTTGKIKSIFTNFDQVSHTQIFYHHDQNKENNDMMMSWTLSHVSTGFHGESSQFWFSYFFFKNIHQVIWIDIKNNLGYICFKIVMMSYLYGVNR